MDKRVSVPWLGRHPVICALFMAVAIGAAPAVQLVDNPYLAVGVLTGIGLVMGTLLGLMVSVSARKERGT